MDLSRAWEMILPHRDSMMRVAQARTMNRADAEDLVQEAMLRAVDRPDLDEKRLGALLRTIVINLWIDQQRHLGTQHRYEARLHADERTQRPVDEAIVDAGEAMWLHALLKDEVREREAEVLLHRAAGHSLASAAEALEMTSKAVESAYTRARLHLRKAWKATLGILIGAAGWVRRGGRGALATPTTVAAALALALLLPHVSNYDAPRRPERELSADDFDRAVVRESYRAPVPSNTRPPNDSSSVPPVETGSTRTAIDTGPIGDRRLVQTGVKVEDDHLEESLMQTLDRCLEKGVLLELSSIGCR